MLWPVTSATRAAYGACVWCVLRVLQANGVPAGGKLAAGTARAGEKQEIRMPPPLTRPVAPAVTKTGDAATAAAAAKSLRREADKENDASKTTTTADEMNRSAAEERNSRPGVIANTTEAKDDAKKTTTEVRRWHPPAGRHVITSVCRGTSVSRHVWVEAYDARAFLPTFLFCTWQTYARVIISDYHQSFIIIIIIISLIPTQGTT